ncbi:TPA: Kiwa anti-phage protein KwaB-like domain-containing protein [Enterococcus faecalis]|uniref:Kiwa anti-phage protein KwaB-like domain-containing protein n=1 Tax=Enterococcus faecalis TaxID=1351 RepID=UPI001920F568|nr:Kiwa anti-phage protein KwaB-like domain-containing protein [Enterococcus faecalis]EHZ9212442.1 DUF4868 domain-containing protein [Enterococcus faecalis]EKF8799203.1 DUF4868 domain-containing protein [Enterococcus faecalis]HAZ2723928.1 DUF4868 domain-containing protein [Enterococcus faecalis]
MQNESKVIDNLFNHKNLDELSTEFFYLRHVNLDEKYKAVEVKVSTEIVNWIKEDIKTNLKSFWDEQNKKFNIKNYNHELTINDTIAKLDLSVDTMTELNLTKEKMIESTINKDKNADELKNSNFNLIKFSIKEDYVYFGYYKGTKKNGKKIKHLIFEGDKFVENTHTMIDLGGPISFIIHKKNVYIIQPRNFEFAFKYSDHITKKRTENINKLIELPFFPDEETKEIFRKKASNHLYSRGLANMNESIFNEITNYYNERCKELKIIYDNISSNDAVKDELQKEKGILIDLIPFIDFDNNNSLIINENSDIKPLLHLFQDKIVETYLTRKIKSMFE